MNNLKSKLLKALMGVSLGALGAFVVTFVIYFWNLDMKLTSVRASCSSTTTRLTATSTCNLFLYSPSASAGGLFSHVNNL